MSNKQLLEQYVSRRIHILLEQRDTSAGRAMLARLRRGVGKVPGELPELWGIFLNELPPELFGNRGNPSCAEWAIYLSLTLFAMHQQGSSEAMHREQQSLGKAAAMLMDDVTDDARQRVMNRLGPVMTAADMQELSHHLRAMIQLFKAKGIALDYMKLAADLYDFQYLESRRKVQLRWGEDFYTISDSEGETQS